MNAPEEQLPVIDWQFLERYGQKSAGAELLDLLKKQLPDMRDKINQAFQDQNIEELSALVHKLQGACSYCGLIRLKPAATKLSHTIKQTGNYDSALLDQFNQEIKLVESELANY